MYIFLMLRPIYFLHTLHFLRLYWHIWHPWNVSFPTMYNLMGVKCTHYKLCSVQSKLVYFLQFWGMKHFLGPVCDIWPIETAHKSLQWRICVSSSSAWLTSWILVYMTYWPAVQSPYRYSPAQHLDLVTLNVPIFHISTKDIWWNTNQLGKPCTFSTKPKPFSSKNSLNNYMNPQGCQMQKKKEENKVLIKMAPEWVNVYPETRICNKREVMKTRGNSG